MGAVAATVAAPAVDLSDVTLSVTVAGYRAPKVAIATPTAKAETVRAAIAWRVEAMRAEVRERVQLGAAVGCVAARRGFTLPRLEECSWQGWRESYGRKQYVKLSAQRVAPGRCSSCGEPMARFESGDCPLCNAARVAALRAEGLLPPAEPLPPYVAPPEVDPYARHARPDPLPPPRRPEPWNCDHCGRQVENLPRDPRGECGPCELARIQVVDTSRLGGSR